MFAAIDGFLRYLKIERNAFVDRGKCGPVLAARFLATQIKQQLSFVFDEGEPQFLRDRRQRVGIGRVQPGRPEVVGLAEQRRIGDGAASNAVARFDDDDRIAGLTQRRRRREAGHTGADDDNIGIGRNLRDASP